MLGRTQYPRLRRSRLGGSRRRRRTRLGDARIRRPTPTGAWRPTLLRLGAVVVAVLVLVLATARVGGPALADVVHVVQAMLRPDPVPMPTPVPGTRKLRGPAVQVILLDGSGSLQLTDPKGQLVKALPEYGRWLVQYGRTRDRFAFVRFADRATAAPGLTTGRALMAGADALAPLPTDGHYTYLLPAVERAEALLAHVPPHARRTAFVLTDGEVPDATQSLRRLARVVDRIEVVVVNHHHSWDPTRTGWRQPGVRLTQIGNDRPNEAGAQMARSFLRITGERAK
jgi:hypothetical protein